MCTQWPFGGPCDKGPSAASRPASCGFLISHCFSQREGHLLIDCLNPLPINTAGSLCDAYPSSSSSSTPSNQLSLHICSWPEGAAKQRLHQIRLPSASWHCLSKKKGIYFIVSLLFMSLIAGERKKRSSSGNPQRTVAAHIGASTRFMSCEMNRGLPNLHGLTPVAFISHPYFIILTAGEGFRRLLISAEI